MVAGRNSPRLPAAGDLYVFDCASRQSRQVTTGARYQFGTPEWSADSSKIALAGDLIDLATGNVLASLVPPQRTIDSALSPDGRFRGHGRL